MAAFRGLMAVSAVAMLMAACNLVPSHVIEPEEMSQLLADRYVAESVVDYNQQHWRTDSDRIALRDAVYARYGVTQADVDTSLVWYGHNMARYMDVTERTIAILEERLAGSDSRLRAQRSLTAAGDSVDVWPDVRYYAVNRHSPTRNITFALDADENRERGDLYTWRVKMANNQTESAWTIVAEYSDSTKEYVAEKINGNGWREISLQTDSTRTAVRIYGSLMLAVPERGAVWLDSVSLVRDRLIPDNYNKRFRQRIIRK